VRNGGDWSTRQDNVTAAITQFTACHSGQRSANLRNADVESSLLCIPMLSSCRARRCRGVFNELHCHGMSLSCSEEDGRL